MPLQLFVRLRRDKSESIHQPRTPINLRLFSLIPTSHTRLDHNRLATTKNHIHIYTEMASTSGLTRRRGGGGGGAGANGESEGAGIGRSNSSTNFTKDGAPETSYESGENGHKIAFDPRDISESAERSKQPKLTLMEEVLLLGLKDKQVSISIKVPDQQLWAPEQGY